MTVLITSVSCVVCILGLAVIFSLLCRKRAALRTGEAEQVTSYKPSLVNLDNVSLESEESVSTNQRSELSGSTNQNSVLCSSTNQNSVLQSTTNDSSVSSDGKRPVTLSTFQNNTDVTMLLPSSSSSSASSTTSSTGLSGSCSGSSQFLQDLKTLDEKYSLVSSTPSGCGLGRERMGRFKTFSESTLLESISETGSDLNNRISGEFVSANQNQVFRAYDQFLANQNQAFPACNQFSANQNPVLPGSTNQRLSYSDHDHSFEHYNHQDQCQCNNSTCQNNQNLTFII